MTIRSMTAFARESASTEQGDLTVELRSVNHRYLDCNIKLPEALRHLEPKLRDAVNARLARGKVDCMVRLQLNEQKESSLTIDKAQLKELLAAAATVEQKLDQARPLSALEILQFPGVCKTRELSLDAIVATTSSLFQAALASLRDSRQREGEKLAGMILERLDAIEVELEKTRALLPELAQHQRDKIIGRIAELDIEVDNSRLEQELVHLAQKADVDEELDRLDAHIGEVRRVLQKGGPCGRRLDFLMQELNREANTLSSKSQSSSTTMVAVELKVLIEQMREQVQNIE